MQVKIEDKGNCRKELEIEVPVEKIKEEYGQLVAYFRQHAALPGFRKGKAPEAMVAAKFKKDIEKELHDKVVPTSFHQALKDQGLEVEHVLDVNEDEFDPEKPFNFKVTLDVKPQVELPEYKGISVEAEKAEVKDEDVEGAIDNIRQQLAKYEDVTDGRGVIAGDLVQVNFEGKVDDQPVKDIAEAAAGIGEGSDFWVRADENAFIPEFAEGLIGVEPGGKTVIDVRFADDFAMEELKGKEAKYEVEVLAIRERVMPELDEEFVKRVGAESVEDFRAQVTKDLASQVEQAQKNKSMGQLQDWLLDNVSVELPESTLQMETQNNIQDIVRQSTAGGESEDNIKENKDEIYENAENAARKTLQMRYILAAIAAKEEITTDDDEVSAEYVRMAQVYGVDPAMIRERVEQNSSQDMVKADIVARKTMDFLFDNAEIKS